MSGWSRLLDGLWRVLARPRLTVVLLGWVALILALSAIIPQTPLDLDDPVARSQWLAQMPMQARATVERLQILGIFNLRNSVWLRIPLALLLAHALVALADIALRLWRRLFEQDSIPLEDEVLLLGKSFRLDQDWPGPGEHVSGRLVEGLKKAGYGVPSEPNQAGFVAWRWRWSWLGELGIYLGLGLAAAGLLLTTWLGEAQELALESDRPVSLSTADRVSWVLDEVTVSGTDPIYPTTAVASMRVLADVGDSRPLALKLHRSRLFRGRWVTLYDLQPVAEVMAYDVQTGDPVLLQPFTGRSRPQERVRLPLTESLEARFVGIPTKNATLQVDYQSNETHTFSLALFRGADDRVAQSGDVVDGEEITLGGVRYRVTLSYNALLRVNAAPWWIVVAVGWGLVALSFAVLLVMPPVHVQVTIEEETDKKAKHSRVMLVVDTLGDSQQLRWQLEDSVLPDD